MKVFLLLYAGPSPELTDLSVDQAQAIVDGWKKWGDSLGQALVQRGMPFLDRLELGSNGPEQKDLPLNGYAIIQAKDMANAITLVQKHPFLADNDGTLAIDIYELMTEPAYVYAKPQATPEPTTVESPGPGVSQTPTTLPPPIPEASQNSGELTIPHETSEEEQTLPPPQA